MTGTPDSHRSNPPSGDGLAARRLLREIVTAVQEPLLVLDAARRVVMASESFHLRFGLSAEESLGRTVYDLAGSGWNGGEMRDLLERAAPAEALGETPLLLGGPRADPVRTHCTVRAVRGGSNQIRLLLLSLRPEAAPASTPADDPLRRLADEHVTDLVALYRLDGDCLYVGDGCRGILGFTPDEWQSLRPCDVVHPADQELLGPSLPARLAEHGGVRLEMRVRRRAGDYLWLDASIRHIRHPEYREVVHVTARDVTQRRRTEEAMQWLSRQVRLILDSAAEGIFGVDAHGLITFMNPAAARELGCYAPELMGRPYAGILPEDGPAGADLIAQTLADGVARRTGEAELVRGDGSRFTAEYACNPARQGGEVVGAVVTFRDVTERLRAEAAMRRAEWLAGVGQAVLAMRHEVNNPLTTLLAEASLLEMGGNSPEEEREMVSSIADQARRIRDVVRRLTEMQDDSPLRYPGSDPVPPLLPPPGHR